jgi:argininosuccinate lyase
MTEKLWGGNYGQEPDPEFWEMNRSFPFDRRLLREDVLASRAFVAALARCGAITAEEAKTLDQGLADVVAQAPKDSREIVSDAEDVHSYIETELARRVGPLAGQAHLGRSRNEQTVTALRLFIRAAIDDVRGRVRTLGDALARLGTEHAASLMPGYTHTRAAEPVTCGHWAAAHLWGLVRDFDRLGDARVRVDVLPLGSGALAGSGLPLDRDALARDLGFAAVSANALDAVSDRDFANEFVFAAAQLQTHLARLAEDLIWFSGPEYGFFTLPDPFTTGSSLMPQKKNPDSLELVRGKAARVDGALLRLLVLGKGLPTGYQKDLQEDKEAVFDAADTVAACTGVMAGVVSGMRVNVEAMGRAAAREDMMAAGLAVALARTGVPFRKAHGLVGEAVAASQSSGGTLRAALGQKLAAVAPELVPRLDELFDPAVSVRARTVPGSTNPDAVKRALLDGLARISR